MFYPLYADPDKLDVSLTKTERHTVEIYPRNSLGEDGCWTWGFQKASQFTDLLIANLANTGKWSVFRKDYLEGTSLFTK
ncbi:MAG: site-specific DNA-methyltransferase, partial [Alphaproteobacteria bacterium]|nr:site-specific DNA-methyltransferase [Alphaproteobacteria bacterium]